MDRNNRNAATSPELPDTPEAADIREIRRRFRFTLAVAATACVVYATALSLTGHAWPLGISDFIWGGVLFSIQRWGLAAPGVQRLVTATHLLGFCGAILLFQHVWYTGLTGSFAVWYFCLVPIAVALLGDLRMVAVWTVVCLLEVVAAHAVQAYAPVVPLFEVTGNLLMFTQMMLVMVATLYSVAALRVNASHLGSLHDAYARLLAQKELLDRQALDLNRSLREAEDARAAADAANRAKSEFLAMMSHEIRTPLNGVIGLNSLLLDLPLDDRARRYAELGRQSGESLLVLINDFLDFSRMEAGPLELEQVPFSPRQVLTDALAAMQSAAQAKGLLLSGEIDVPAQLTGDPGRLRQILLNLLGNAVKFTPRGEVRLTGHLLADAGAEAWLRIEVQDTGIGIAPDAQKRLFQPFTQADASTTRHYGGTGLGLAICRALALRMGGRIGVQSRPGEGSTFWVELPFAQPDDAAAVRAALSAPLHRRFRGRVLVAEDNPVNQLVARDMLARLGVVVDIAADGEQAIHAAGARDYDLVLMDCEMPGIDGYDATRAIRALDGPRSQVHIVAMTAGVLAGNEERCRAAGMDDFLAKPVRLADLEKLLARYADPAGT